MKVRRTFRTAARRGLVSLEIVDATDDTGVIMGDPIAGTDWMSRSEAIALLEEMIASLRLRPRRRRVVNRRPEAVLEVSADGTQARVGVRDPASIFVAGDAVIWSAWGPADDMRSVTNTVLG